MTKISMVVTSVSTLPKNVKNVVEVALEVVVAEGNSLDMFLSADSISFRGGFRGGRGGYNNDQQQW